MSDDSELADIDTQGVVPDKNTDYYSTSDADVDADGKSNFICIC